MIVVPRALWFSGTFFIAAQCLDLKLDISRYTDGRTISINGGSLPVGPAIRLRNGEEFNLLIENRLEDPTGIHFHGLLFENVPKKDPSSNEWAVLGDGVPGVTQYEIPPQHGYWQNVTVGQDTCGTFWYHSHYSVQYGEGLRGPVIVECDKFLQHEQSVAKQYLLGERAQEQIITLSDWYKLPHKDVLAHIESPWQGADPRVDGSLFNGKQDSDQVIRVSSKTQYMRFRIINMANSNTQVFHISNHKMIVIETDGVLVKPVELETLTLATGQRYTVLVKRNEDNEDAEIVHGCSKMMGYYVKSHVLKYSEGSADSAPAERHSSIKGLPGFTKTELYKRYEPIGWALLPDAPKEHQFTLDYEESRSEDTETRFGTGMFYVNSITMGEYTETETGDPLILDANASKVAPIDVGYGSTVDIVINSIDHMRHPWHLHGHHFQVISMGVSGDGALYWNDPSSQSYKKYTEDLSFWKESGQVPMTRDSINIEGHSYAVIRFRSDSPGLWLLHCHVDWHMVKGLGVVLQEGLKTVSTEMLRLVKPFPLDKPEFEPPAPPEQSTKDPQDPSASPSIPPEQPSPAEPSAAAKQSTHKLKVLAIYIAIMFCINVIAYIIFMH